MKQTNTAQKLLEFLEMEGQPKLFEAFHEYVSSNTTEPVDLNATRWEACANEIRLIDMIGNLPDLVLRRAEVQSTFDRALALKKKKTQDDQNAKRDVMRSIYKSRSKRNNS